MGKTFTEADAKIAKSAWVKKFGTQPDVNSEEFKKFQSEVNKIYNDKYAIKKAAQDNIGNTYVKLEKVYANNAADFPKALCVELEKLPRDGKIQLCKLLLQKENLGATDTQQHVNFPPEIAIWLEVIGKLFEKNKSEAAHITIEALKESTKYPWINGLLNHRLIKEDDFDLGSFDASVAGAGGMDISSDSSTTTSTDTDTTDNSDFNLDDYNTGSPDTSMGSMDGKGAIDSIGFGGGLDAPAAPVDPNAPVRRVIDVVFDPEDPEAYPKVKVQDTKTGEISIKDIFELDV